MKKMVSNDTADSAREAPAALIEKPAWINNLTPKGLPLKARTAIKKEMDALRKGGVVEPHKKLSS